MKPAEAEGGVFSRYTRGLAGGLSLLYHWGAAPAASTEEVAGDRGCRKLQFAGKKNT